MKKSFKLISLFGVSAALAFGGMAVINDYDSNVSHTVEASATTQINFYAGYTKSNVLKANGNGRLSKSQRAKLVKGSMNGMIYNKFSDDDPSDNRTVDVTNLSKSDKEEISRYALAVINSARRHFGKKNWTYSYSAVKFADEVARQYNRDGASVWDSDHDVKGIARAAKIRGLNYRAGQVYEDESGLPISDEFHGRTRTMKKLKEQIYFNIKQMLFGGYSGNDYHNTSAYYEWEHAGDLLGLRTKKRDAKTKQFGLSFSSLDGTHISVHMMGVAKRYILNYKKYNK